MKNKSLIGILLFVLFISILGFSSLVLVSSPPQRSSAREMLFAVTRGQSVRTISKNLKNAGLVRSAAIASLYSRLHKLRLKAGTYRLSTSQNLSTVLGIIAEGKQETVRVTVPEGLTLGKTAAHFEGLGLFPREEFINAAKNPLLLQEFGITAPSLEGFLFPDTYFFPIGSDPAVVLRIMLQNFFIRISSIPGAPANPLAVYEKLILASVVEREYRIAEEAPLIASVFANRLSIGMGLQSCATIEYIITEIQGNPHPSRLLVSDLEIPSDFNTYLWAGLPPGPICSPGLIALDAAFNYPKTPYLYFRLTDPAIGAHSFTRSLEEHVRAGRQLYLKQAAGR